MVILSKVDPRTHYGTREIKTSAGCLHVFDYILWFSYNAETKFIQFNHPNTSCLLQCIPLHQTKTELDHSNDFKLFSTSEKKKLTPQYFPGTLGISIAKSNIQISSYFSLPDFFGAHLIFGTNNWKTQKSCLMQVVITTHLVF